MTRKEFEMNLLLLGAVKRNISNMWVNVYNLNESKITVSNNGVVLRLMPPYVDYGSPYLKFDQALYLINKHLDEQEKTNGKET